MSASAILWFGQEDIDQNVIAYFPPGYQSDPAVANLASEIAVRLPFAGNLRNVMIRQNQAATLIATTTYEVLVNGVVAFTIDVLSNASSGEDTSTVVPVTRGDRVAVRYSTGDFVPLGVVVSMLLDH